MSSIHAILLALLEGLTEFIPVSSTGHILLAGHFLGFCSPGKSFEILIQLGAILAVVSVYFGRLMQLAVAAPSSAEARRFIAAVLVAFLPAAVVGAGLAKYIDMLLESPFVICVTLILGGIVLLFVDRLKLKPYYTTIMDIPIGTAFKIGICQCLAMIPGVSRSGATIVGAMFMGCDKRTAAEFSFFLAMPTMTGAFAFKLMQHRADLTGGDVANIALGFVVAFLAGLFVVRHLLEYVSRNGFALFAWWRIIVGGLSLGALLVGGTASVCA